MKSFKIIWIREENSYIIQTKEKSIHYNLEILLDCVASSSKNRKLKCLTIKEDE